MSRSVSQQHECEKISKRYKSNTNTLFLGRVLYFTMPPENELRLYFPHGCPKLSMAQISVQSIAFPAHLLYSMHTACIHIVERSAVLADPNIRLIVETPPVNGRIANSRHLVKI